MIYRNFVILFVSVMLQSSLLVIFSTRPRHFQTTHTPAPQNLAGWFNYENGVNGHINCIICTAALQQQYLINHNKQGIKISVFELPQLFQKSYQ